MSKKAIEILKEVAQAKGKEVKHELLHDVLEIVQEALPKLATEAEEAGVKQIAGIALLVLPVVVPAIEEAIEKA